MVTRLCFIEPTLKINKGMVAYNNKQTKLLNVHCLVFIVNKIFQFKGVVTEVLSFIEIVLLSRLH